MHLKYCIFDESFLLPYQLHSAHTQFCLKNVKNLARTRVIGLVTKSANCFKQFEKFRATQNMVQ